MGRVHTFGSCCISLGLLLTCVAEATTVKAFDTPALVRASDLVLRARVGQSTSLWNTSRTRIYTDSRLRPLEVLFDAVGGSRSPRKPSGIIKVRQLGGRVGDTRMRVSGTARFQEGDEVVVFLRRHDGFYTLVGMAQGCVTIKKTSTGLKAVTDLHGATPIQPSSPPLGRSVGPAPESNYWRHYERRLKTLIQQRLLSGGVE